MTLRRTLLGVLLLIVVAGVAIRLYRLGSIPGGLTWDEAAIGYNGWSVLTTRRDEWLSRLPISFRSFGDYKAPVAIYLNGPFTYFLGFSAWSIRLPFALSGGILLVIWTGFLYWLNKQRYLSLASVIFGVALLAFSPWHVVFSRIGFESGLALTALVSSVFALLFYLKNPHKYWSLGLAVMMGIGSIYAYHSAKIVTPLLIGFILWLWRSKWKSFNRPLILAGTLAMVLLVPLVVDSVWGSGATRAGDLWLFAQISVGEKLITFLNSFWRNLDPRFLLLGQGDEIRHVSGKFGIVSPAVLALVIGSFIGLVKGIWQRFPTEQKHIYFLALGWLVIGLLPSWLSTQSPHANRALLALPGFLLLAIVTFNWLILQIRTSSQSTLKNIWRICIGLIIITELMWATVFMYDYFSYYSHRASAAYNEGYQDAVKIASDALGGQSKPVVDQVIFSSQYGQPYIYVLLFNQISPLAYHNGALVKYLFPDQVTMGDVSRPNALLIYTPKDLEVNVKPDGTILGSDGNVRFYYYFTQ